MPSWHGIDRSRHILTSQSIPPQDAHQTMGFTVPQRTIGEAIDRLVRSGRPPDGAVLLPGANSDGPGLLDAGADAILALPHGHIVDLLGQMVQSGIDFGRPFREPRYPWF